MSSVDWSTLVDEPGLAETVVTVVVDDVSVVGVGITIDLEALLSVVSDVSSGTGVPSGLLGVISRVLSDDNRNVDSELVTLTVSEAVGSLEEWSHSSGS